MINPHSLLICLPAVTYQRTKKICEDILM